MSRRSGTNFKASCFVLILLAGCGGQDPMGPVPPPTAGITVFARADYRGPHRTFLDDVEDLKRLVDDPQPREEECADKIFGQEYWTDCVSSIRVADGWQAVVYQHDTYRGDSLVVTSDIPDLSAIQMPSSPEFPTWTWDETISSIRVRRETRP
ncbi:MAG: beta/gamma crystallin-related protein [Gemmatimonadetes bacterium]|nr:beta/gamma crystallin-related protein [Candidatus Palauibacter australiensis]MCZ0935569.1 beta/gamma crystallin-related protein [Candidatus Palauibacter rhopaloidicola]